MGTWKAREYQVTDSDIVPTGRVEVYTAETAHEAARQCLYTRRLADGNARMGPTELVVHSRGLAYAITA